MHQQAGRLLTATHVLSQSVAKVGTMSRHNWTDRSARPQGTRREESLTDKRYEELLKTASTFFAAAQGNSEDERQAVILEIIALMEQYGLSVDDLH